MPTIQWVRCPGGTTRERTRRSRCCAAPRLAAAAAAPAPHHSTPIAEARHEGLAGGHHGEARGQVRGQRHWGGLRGSLGEGGGAHWGTAGRGRGQAVYTGAAADVFAFVVCDGTAAVAAAVDGSGDVVVGNIGGCC